MRPHARRSRVRGGLVGSRARQPIKAGVGGLPCYGQRLFVARHTEVLNEAIDGKRIGDDTVCPDHNLVAGFIYHKNPVPVFVPPVALQEAILIYRGSPPGLSGIRTHEFRVRVLIRDAIDQGRESPQRPGVRPDVLVAIENRAVIGQASPHTAVLPVNTVLNPKRHNLLCQVTEEERL